MTDEKEIKPVKEYWVCFPGIDPVKVGPKILQKLVNSRGENLDVMDGDQIGGWKKAKDFGFHQLIKSVDELVPQPTIFDDKLKVTIYSPQESLERIMAISIADSNKQVSLITIAGVIAPIPAFLAVDNIKYKGARLIKE